MVRSFGKIVSFALLALIFSGCATVPEPQGPVTNLLRIGITPNYPPMIFKLNEEIKGAEADFALRLGQALNRQVRFVELAWDKQIPSLIEGTIDIIMSGMTVTEARKARISFAEPYLKSGLVTLMRAEDATKFLSLRDIQEGFVTVGVISGTTGEAYVRKNFLNAANIIAVQRASDAPNLLTNMRIDLFVNDIPSIVWLVSENEGTLKGFWEPLTVEYLGWGIRGDDKGFLMEVNATLNRWKQDGTLGEILTRWLPYWKKFD
jgi:ABC-type amino acid transport substrate-binding protein